MEGRWGKRGCDLILVFPKPQSGRQPAPPLPLSESTEERERNLVGRVGKDLVQAGGGNTNGLEVEIQTDVRTNRQQQKGKRGHQQLTISKVF